VLLIIEASARAVDVFEARLHNPVEKVPSDGFVTGHDFSRADKPLIFVIPRRLHRPPKESSSTCFEGAQL
jgi:hypothetical protein